MPRKCRKISQIESPKQKSATRKKPVKSAAHNQRVIGPVQLDLAERELIRGRSVAAIAKELGVHPSTLQEQVDRHLRPAWRAKLRRAAEIELAKIDHLEAIAWQKMLGNEPGETQTEISRELLEGGSSLELVKIATRRIRRPGSTAWAMVIQWAIELRCKLLGHYKAADARIEEKDEFRVAGMSTDELDAKMMKLLLDKVMEKRRERAAMRRNGYPG